MNPPVAESVAQSDVNGAITSGGGFSIHYPRPYWQSGAVSAYFTGASASGPSPLPGYNRNGRGYPDISAAGKERGDEGGMVTSEEIVYLNLSCTATSMSLLLLQVKPYINPTLPVLLSGVSYATYIGGALWYLSGTSASTPVIAAMISNINASRRKNGKGSVGWLNPALYKYASEFVNDVTVGHNKCVAGGAVCCRTGFHATKGWDPTTGALQYSAV